MKLQNTKSILTDNRSILAFTMIEVAMSLAIVAFAMVAIMGVLPTGLNVQRQNAEETIVSQDSTYLLEAMRQGTLAASLFQLESNLTLIDVKCERVPEASVAVGNPAPYFWSSPSPLRPGISNLVLHLARPKRSETFYDVSANSYYYFTNSVRLRMYAMSGNLTAIFGGAVVDDRMQYEVQIEVIPDGSSIVNNPNVFSTNNFSSAFTRGNLHTIKLTYRWPVLPNGNLGAGRKVLSTRFRGTLKPMRLNAGSFEALEVDNSTDIQRLSDLDPATMKNYGHVFEGTLLR